MKKNVNFFSTSSTPSDLRPLLAFPSAPPLASPSATKCPPPPPRWSFASRRPTQPRYVGVERALRDAVVSLLSIPSHVVLAVRAQTPLFLFAAFHLLKASRHFDFAQERAIDRARVPVGELKTKEGGKGASAKSNLLLPLHLQTISFLPTEWSLLFQRRVLRKGGLFLLPARCGGRRSSDGRCRGCASPGRYAGQSCKGAGEEKRRRRAKEKTSLVAANDLNQKKIQTSPFRLFPSPSFFIRLINSHRSAPPPTPRPPPSERSPPPLPPLLLPPPRLPSPFLKPSSAARRPGRRRRRRRRLRSRRPAPLAGACGRRCFSR